MKKEIENLYDFKWIDSINEEGKNEFKEALNSYIFFKKNTFDLTKKIVNKYPSLISPKILLISLILLSRDRTNIKLAKKIFDTINFNSLNEYQEDYLKVLKKWIEGNLFQVVENLQKIISINSKDIFAIRLFHFNNIFIGLKKRFLESHLEIIEKWSEKDTFYNLILGMTSFAFEENNEYSNAYKYAETSLKISKGDLWSWHALLHIHDSKIDTVISLQDEYEKINWNLYGPMKNHLWWHQSLFFYYQKNYKKCLEMYDKYIFPEDNFYLDFCNASSLLLRLNTKGVDVKNRMDKLKPLANYFRRQNLIPFIDFHLVLFFKYYNEKKYFSEFKSLIKSNYNKSSFSKVFDKYLLPLSDNILNNNELDLNIIKSNFVDLGGSFAQRELIYLYLYNINKDKNFRNKLFYQIQSKKNLKTVRYA